MPVLCRIFIRAATELPPQLPGGGPHRRLRRTPREDLKASRMRDVEGCRTGWRLSRLRALPPRMSFSVTTSRASARRTVMCAPTGALHLRPRRADERRLRRSSTSRSGPCTSARRRPGRVAALNAGMGSLASEDRRRELVGGAGDGGQSEDRYSERRCRVRECSLERAGRGSQAMPRCRAIVTTDGSAARTGVATASGP
jgi:hypothetical protein